MKCRLFTTCLATLAIAGLSVQALAQSDHQGFPARKQVVKTKHMIPSAVQVRITPRGATYFETKLSAILGNLGVSLDEGQFDASKIESQKPLKLDQMQLPPQTQELVEKVRSLLTDWLIGFPLKDIRPGIDIGKSGYTATFTRFALIPDENLLQQIGKKDGAVLAIELEVKQLNINLTRIRAFDLNAPMLGEVGFDGLSLKVGGATPMKLRLPFHVRINEKEQLEFEALNVDENLQSTNVEFAYKKLVAPQIVLEVNGHRMEFNQARLEKELLSNMPLILQKARGFLSEFATQKIPALLNQKAKEMTTGALEEVSRFEPPGAEKGKVVEPFLWGLRLEKISQKNGIGVKLKAFVEDPLNPNSTPVKELGSRGPVALTELAANQFDIAMSIDRALINRILQLSFERRMFERISVGEGYLQLTASPAADFVALPAGFQANKGEAFLKLRIQARVPHGSVSGFNKLFLRDNFEVSFDLIAKLRKVPYNSTSPAGGVELVLVDILSDSIWLNPQDIKLPGKLFPEKVLSGVVDKMKEISNGWKQKEQKLPGTLPLPPEILGIKLEIEHMLLDPNGHLVMYLKYAQKEHL